MLTIHQIIYRKGIHQTIYRVAIVFSSSIIYHIIFVVIKVLFQSNCYSCCYVITYSKWNRSQIRGVIMPVYCLREWDFKHDPLAGLHYVVWFDLELLLEQLFTRKKNSGATKRETSLQNKYELVSSLSSF